MTARTRAAAAWGRVHYLVGQPAFRANPLLVAARCLQWRTRGLSGRAAMVRVHRDCLMRVFPTCQGFGADGLVFCFRDLYEPGVRAALLSLLTPGDVAYDIGAHSGYWTLLMSRLVGRSGRVTAFEPVPATAQKLRANLALSHARAVTEQLALGNDAGTAMIYVPRDPGRASLAPASPHDRVVGVEVVTLDEYWAAHGRPQVAFLKLDAEGSEPRILRGAERLFDRCRPTVACEVNPRMLEPLGHCTEDIYRFFDRHEYQPFVWVDAQRAFLPARYRPAGDVVFRPVRGSGAT